MDLQELRERLSVIAEEDLNIEILKEMELADDATMYIINFSPVTKTKYNTSDTTSVIVYDDGTLFHQQDWQGGYAKTAEEIAEFDWLTEDLGVAIIMNGLPKQFI